MPSLKNLNPQLCRPSVATLIGLAAPVTWAMNVPLMRAVVEGFGVAAGECILYATATAGLFFSVGLPNLRRSDPRYLVCGVSSAVACTLCLVLAVYFSQDAVQTMEVGMVNYLWPAFIIAGAVLFLGEHATFWLVPGLVLCACAVFWIISGGAFSPASFARHAAANPLSYALALGAALTWTIYSLAARRWGRGQNLSTLIFALDTAVFAILWISGFGNSPAVTAKGIISVAAGGLAAGLAYGCWTHGMLYGRIPVLSVASYFTPAMSCLFGVLWIDARLTESFWLGCAVLMAGSLLCWHSSQTKSKNS